MVITKERPQRSPALKNRTAKVLFEAAAGTETLKGGAGLTLLRLVPAAFDTTLSFVHSARGGEVASLAVSPAEVHEKLVSYWKDHRQLPMTDRLEFIIKDMAALAKMSADTEQALMLQMVFHSVSDKIQPFMPHAGLRLIYDTSPKEARWALARLSESKPINLGDNALYVDIITTEVAHGAQGVGGGSDSVEERKETFLSLLESAQKPALVSKQQGASEIGPEIFARVVDIGWLNGYLEEYEFPEEDEIDAIHSPGAHHHIGLHPSHGGAEHDHDLSNFAHVAATHAALAHEMAEHAAEADHAASGAAHDAGGAHAAAEHGATEHAGDGAAHDVGTAHGIDAGHGAYLQRHADEVHKHQEERAHEERAETERAEAERLEAEAHALEHEPGRHGEAEELLAEAAGEREMEREDNAEALQEARDAEFDRQQDAGLEAMERAESAEYAEAEYADVEYPERAEYAEIEYPEPAEYAELEYAESAEAPEIELAEAEYAEAAEVAEGELAEVENAEAELAEGPEIEVSEVAEAIETAEIAEAETGEGVETGEGIETVEAGGAEAEAFEAPETSEAPEAPEAVETVEAGESPEAPETGAEAGGPEPAGAAEQQEEMNESLRSVQESEGEERGQTERSIDEANDRAKDMAEKQEQTAEQINESAKLEQNDAQESQETEREAQQEQVRAEQTDNQSENAQRADDQNFDTRPDRQESENTQQRDAGTAEGRYQELRDEVMREENDSPSDGTRGSGDPFFHHAHDFMAHPIHYDQSHALRDHFSAGNGHVDHGLEVSEQGARWQAGWHLPVGEHNSVDGFQQAGLAATRGSDGSMGFNGGIGSGASDSFSNYFVPVGAVYGLGQIAPVQWPGAMAAKQDPVDQATRSILQNHYEAQMNGADGGMKVKRANFGYSFGGAFGKMPGLSPAPSEEG